MNQPKKKNLQQPWSDSFFENFKDLGSGIVKSAVNDAGKSLVKGIPQGFMDSFLGGVGGEALDRQEPLAQVERREKPKQTYYERFREETILFKEQDREVVREIDSIRMELRALMRELGEIGPVLLEAEKAIAMETVAPGKYHISFFERLRRIISLFRKQVAESRTWLTTNQNKKKQRSYWKMFKKHGTTFGLSGERVIATQAG